MTLTNTMPSNVHVNEGALSLSHELHILFNVSATKSSSSSTNAKIHEQSHDAPSIRKNNNNSTPTIHICICNCLKTYYLFSLNDVMGSGYITYVGMSSLLNPVQIE